MSRPPSASRWRRLNASVCPRRTSPVWSAAASHARLGTSSTEIDETARFPEPPWPTFRHRARPTPERAPPTSVGATLRWSASGGGAHAAFCSYGACRNVPSGAGRSSARVPPLWRAIRRSRCSRLRGPETRVAARTHARATRCVSRYGLGGTEARTGVQVRDEGRVRGWPAREAVVGQAGCGPALQCQQRNTETKPVARAARAYREGWRGYARGRVLARCAGCAADSLRGELVRGWVRLGAMARQVGRRSSSRRNRRSNSAIRWRSCVRERRT
jgi:hypothetical protein